MITANQIICALKGSPDDASQAPPPCPAWVCQAALLFRPNRFGRPYDTIQVQFFTQVTVRIPATKIAKRSKQPYETLQRRRLDLVALVQPNYKAYEPLAIGVEVKVAEADLVGDSKLIAYLPYVHLFYLAVPRALSGAARRKLAAMPDLSPAGLLLVDEQGTRLEIQPKLTRPTDTHLKELYAELLIKPFKILNPGEDCPN